MSPAQREKGFDSEEGFLAGRGGDCYTPRDCYAPVGMAGERQEAAKTQIRDEKR